MWINLKISKTWIDVGVRLLISMNLLRKTRQIFHQSVLNLCFFVLSMATPSKTPPGADPKQLERTGTVREIGSQAVWSLSSCKPGNYSLRPPPIQSAVWTDDCKHLSEVDTISEIVLFFSLELFICISTFSQRSKQFALLHNCHVWINFRGRWDQF